jgi:phosphatidate cytidylyltransferase
MTQRAHAEVGEPAGIKPRSLLIRVGTALLYGIAVLGSLLLGPLATGIVFGVMSGFAAAEFYAMERREARLPNELFGVAAAAFMPVAAALWGLPGLSSAATALIAASLVWHTLFRRTRTADTAITVFGALYTGFLLAYLVLILATFEEGLFLSLVLVVSVWVSDVFAYFFGSLLGRHRLAPHISPKKSWEGFAAGAAGTVLVWALAPLWPNTTLAWGPAIATGVAVAVASLIGDLAESRMKREAGVKDSGTSLPGHGGFLDRLDSLILVCLVAYWVLWWGGVR